VSRKAAANVIAVALLLLIFVQALGSARLKSPTMDEQNHIARGLAYLRTGDLRLSVEHPPLVRRSSCLWIIPRGKVGPGMRSPTSSCGGPTPPTWIASSF